jgi:hypothetical protein
MTHVPKSECAECKRLTGEVDRITKAIESERAGFIEKQLQFDHDRTVFADMLLKLEQKTGREVRDLKESLNLHARLVAALLDAYEQEIGQHPDESSEPK